ncbi:hypothetical protein TNCV_2966421 [Trichonephila clavipes]|nr:hypothetical protein TNCV_2966421 [Trichonephila clavipes]
MFDPSSFANPTPLAHADTSRDVLPRGGTSQSHHTLLVKAIIRYNPGDDYCLSQDILIGTMTEVCHNCKALKLNGETKGMCCTNRKIKLPQLEE